MLRKQGSCGEVESGVIRGLLVLHWLKKKRESEEGQASSRRFDRTPASTRTRTPRIWGLNPDGFFATLFVTASDSVSDIRES